MAVSRQKEGSIAELFDRLKEPPGLVLGQELDRFLSALSIGFRQVFVGVIKNSTV